MMDSEKRELRKKRTKKILLMTVGIAAIAILITLGVIYFSMSGCTP
jgi:hypothetical protein